MIASNSDFSFSIEFAKSCRTSVLSLHLLYRTALRTTGDWQSLGEFLDEHLVAKSDLFQQIDLDADGKLQPSELAAFLGPRFVVQTDIDGDRQVSKDDAGEILWNVIAVVDENEDGFVDQPVYFTAYMRSQFSLRDNKQWRRLFK